MALFGLGQGDEGIGGDGFGGSVYSDAARAGMKQRQQQADEERFAGNDAALGTAGGALGAVVGAYFGGPGGAAAGWKYGQQGGKTIAAIGDGRSEEAADRFVQSVTGGIDLLGKKKPRTGGEVFGAEEALQTQEGLGSIEDATANIA